MNFVCLYPRISVGVCACSVVTVPHCASRSLIPNCKDLIFNCAKALEKMNIEIEMVWEGNFKIKNDFNKIFICLPRLVVNSLKWQFAHPFTVFMFNGNLLQNFCKIVFFTFHEYVVCFSNFSHAN